MQQCQLSLHIDSTDYSVPLGAEVWLDNHCIFETEHVDQAYPVTYQFDDVDADHELRVILKNKTQAHTQIDALGNIVADARLCVGSVAFDQVQLDQILIEHATYTHNHNGTTAEITESFYGELGCNGTMSLKFSAPVYVWLLENM